MRQRQNVLVYQEEGFTPAPTTLPVIRVVLLHTEWFVQSFNEPITKNAKFPILTSLLNKIIQNLSNCNLLFACFSASPHQILN